MRHVSLLPTLACPASCSYCFGPHGSGEIMSHEVVERAATWAGSLHRDGELRITFHGGEPLLAGAAWFRRSLEILTGRLSHLRVHLSVQSNLWLLDDELCRLFVAHGVGLGTSLDGPETITDGQRGEGYWRRTMRGVHRARAHGLQPGCVCTFTARSAPRLDEVFSFFAGERMDFSVHPAVASLGAAGGASSRLGPQGYARLLEALWEHYLANPDQVRVGNLDAMAASLFQGSGAECMFDNCLGKYAAVDPHGRIYTCQRFAEDPTRSIGNVRDCPSMESLASSPFWMQLEQLVQEAARECADCSRVAICRGGCLHQALSAPDRGEESWAVDPYCEAYKSTFALMADRAAGEAIDGYMQGNRAADRRPAPGVRSLAEGPHPSELARRARLVLASVTLAQADDVEAATHRFEALGLVGSSSYAREAFTALEHRLRAPRPAVPDTLYVHVTTRCSLRCSHCYSRGGEGEPAELPPARVARLLDDAIEAGVSRFVITGGEPLEHPDLDGLLSVMTRREGRIERVLRTSLVSLPEPRTLARIAAAFDQVGVSIDGDAKTHDARRGPGTHLQTVSNLKQLLSKHGSLPVLVDAFLPPEDALGEPGRALQRLAQDLRLQRVSFRQVLPLGRAVGAAGAVPPAAPRDAIFANWNRNWAGPRSSCGLGRTMSVASDGAFYPCHALTLEAWRVGAWREEGGLAAILSRRRWQALREDTVDCRPGCSRCALRYLCGGACRAWRPESPPWQGAAVAPDPVQCHWWGVYRTLVRAACEQLRIDAESWWAVPSKSP
jgi:uncharacterized protein